MDTQATATKRVLCSLSSLVTFVAESLSFSGIPSSIAISTKIASTNTTPDDHRYRSQALAERVTTARACSSYLELAIASSVMTAGDRLQPRSPTSGHRSPIVTTGGG